MTIDSHPPAAPTLLTGATGFVGGALLERLLETRGLRALVRDPSKLDERPGLEVVEADLTRPDTLGPALDGAGVAYYLVHSMEAGTTGFADQDRESARNFAAAARTAGLRRIVYLGGVMPADEDADGESEHLRSREEVEQILSSGAPEFVSLRASMLVGAGSESFRTLVQLVARLPVLALPSWRDSRSQPVAIDDAIEALVAAATVEPGVYEIAGADTLSFERMTEVVAELLGKPHRALALPFTNSKLEGLASAVVTDSDVELLEPLLAGLHQDLLVAENSLGPVFGVAPTPFREAAGNAIDGMRVAATV